ncbi:MAG: hypothetical protein M1820_005995 [Bogoriella megaspora]|nr:MAG: hypothetical protein M1820_005995 [Bogoriella megaspora]
MSEKQTMEMQHIPTSSLTSLPSRISYLKSFLKFTPEDGAAIHQSSTILAPLVPTILDAVYTNLLSYDITAKAFAPRQPGYTGPAPSSVQDLSLTHPQILHRKDFLKRYLVQLVSNEDWSDDAMLWGYMDKVGVMHTGEPGFKHREKRPELRVEYVHMGALLAYVEDLVVGAVMGADRFEVQEKVEMVRAWNKLLWIQNDLFARHYVVDRESEVLPKGVQFTKDAQTRHPRIETRVLAFLLSFLVAVLIVKQFR